MLFKAVEDGKEKIFEYLVSSKRFNLNQKDNKGRTALFIGILELQNNIIKNSFQFDVTRFNDY